MGVKSAKRVWHVPTVNCFILKTSASGTESVARCCSGKKLNGGVPPLSMLEKPCHPPGDEKISLTNLASPMDSSCCPAAIGSLVTGFKHVCLSSSVRANGRTWKAQCSADQRAAVSLRIHGYICWSAGGCFVMDTRRETLLLRWLRSGAGVPSQWSSRTMMASLHFHCNYFHFTCNSYSRCFVHTCFCFDIRFWECRVRPSPGPCPRAYRWNHSIDPSNLNQCPTNHSHSVLTHWGTSDHAWPLLSCHISLWLTLKFWIVVLSMWQALLTWWMRGKASETEPALPRVRRQCPTGAVPSFLPGMLISIPEFSAGYSRIPSDRCDLSICRQYVRQRGTKHWQVDILELETLPG